jgi:GNAT superfamily N-acetyltransferase
MADTMLRTARAATVTIRSYRPTDHRDCRHLWAELTQGRQSRYSDDALPEGADHGAAFEEYLTRLDLSGMWVAEDAGTGVVGLIGLILSGRGGEVEPVIVTASRRGEGIGRALLGRVAEEAGRRGLKRLTISPDSRNVDAIRCLHAAGYDALASVTLAIDLDASRGSWRDGVDLHDLRFQY